MGSAQSNLTARSAERRRNDPMQHQMRIESAILTEDTTCSAKLSQVAGGRTAEEMADQIDQFFLKNKLDNGFYDFEFMEAFSCLLRVGLVTDRSQTASRYLKLFFTDQKQIGGLSAAGVAMMSGIKELKSMVVIKAPRRPGFDNLIHEYFVAVGGGFRSASGAPRSVIGTNMLRKVCLNYAQILGAFRCGPPDIDPLSKRLRSWCDTTMPSAYVNYVVYEKIPGPDINKMAKSGMTATLFITSMLQIAFALELGQMYNGFTHYDLHYENVIMREANPSNPTEEVQIPFVFTEDMTYYVESAYIPTIIDFGRSHIQTPPPGLNQGVEVEHFGYHDAYLRENYGVFADKARPYYDIYKILGFTLFAMRQAQNPAFLEVWPIMGFFGLRTLDQVNSWLDKGMSARPGAGPNLFSAVVDIERMGFCIAKDLAEGSVCLSENVITMFDLIGFIQVQFSDIWQAKVRDLTVSGKRIMKCGADCTNFSESIFKMTGFDADTNITNLATLGDYRNIMRYRNAVERRANYFKETAPQSLTGDKLMKEVVTLDNEIKTAYNAPSQSQDQLTLPESLGAQVMQLGEKVQMDYANIQYPIVYNPRQSTDPTVIAQEFMSLNGYLDRMGQFFQTYIEFKEFFEACEDMARISGQSLDQSLVTFLNDEISPRFQAVEESRGKIRSIVEPTVIPREYETAKNDLLMRTM